MTIIAETLVAALGNLLEDEDRDRVHHVLDALAEDSEAVGRVRAAAERSRTHG